MKDNEAKVLLLKKLFFRLADPNYKIPTEVEFDAVKNEVEAKIGTKPKAAKNDKGKLLPNVESSP